MLRSALSILALISLTAPAAVAEPPQVVADILPVGAIVARVMQGVGAPDVMVPPGTSPHDYAMRPSQARQLAQADLVVWVGPALTVFLEKPLAALATNATRLTLLDLDLNVLTFRNEVSFDPHDHDHDHGNDTGGAVDPHLWLDPANAALIADAVAGALAQIDAANAPLYTGNAEDFRAELAALRAEIDTLLAPVRGQPFLVLHDAFHYFEAAFGVEASAAVIAGDATTPGAARLSDLRQRLVQAPVVCAFAEPQMDTALIDTAVEGRGARIAQLDPMGDAQAPAATRYVDMLRTIAQTMARCLARG